MRQRTSLTGCDRRSVDLSFCLSRKPLMIHLAQLLAYLAFSSAMVVFENISVHCSANYNVQLALSLSSGRSMDLFPKKALTSDAGSQYRCGWVGRGNQPPSTPQPTPTLKHTQNVSKMLVFPLYNSVRLWPPTYGRTDKASYRIACPRLKTSSSGHRRFIGNCNATSTVAGSTNHTARGAPPGRECRFQWCKERRLLP